MRQLYETNEKKCFEKSIIFLKFRKQLIVELLKENLLGTENLMLYISLSYKKTNLQEKFLNLCVKTLV